MEKQDYKWMVKWLREEGFYNPKYNSLKIINGELRVYETKGEWTLKNIIDSWDFLEDKKVTIKEYKRDKNKRVYTR